jgi:hypothetical protein
MTDESWNLDITNIKFLDLRRKRRSYRRLGKAPPAKISVNITVESYELIRRLAYAEGRRNSPFYEQVESLIDTLVQTKKELAEKQAFLDLAIEDKKQLRQELEKVKLVISKFNDQRVSLPEDSS